MFTKPRLSFLLIFVLLFSLFALSSPKIKKSILVNRQSEEYLDTNLKRTGIAFAASRAVNALVSFLQDVDVGGDAIVASIEGSPGEFLDPVNDLVERFSWLMLLCFTILSIEKIFLEIFQSAGLYLLAGASAFLLLSVWWKKTQYFTKIFF